MILVLVELFLHYGVPQHIWSDNGPEFMAKQLRRWLKTLQLEPLYIEPGSPWEKGYAESFNGTIRDQLLNGELFYTLKEAQIMTERWWSHYNTACLHSSLGGWPPAHETLQLAS